MDSAIVSIEFSVEDLLPPRFDEDFYYATIDSPEFSVPKDLIIDPPIHAYDGDIAINEEILYEISDQTCKYINARRDGE